MTDRNERKIKMEGVGITKKFGGLVAVNEVSFKLYEHEILGLIGPNGAGKTTLFNLISGSAPMTEGTLYYRGERIRKPRANRMCRMGIGRTYQICQPFGNLTVVENVMTGAFLRHSRPGVAREKAEEILGRVGLANRANASGSDLTLPELKRMEVARALATEPDVLLLDEVVAGLNPTEVETIMRLIRQIRDGGMTIIIIEHVMRAIMNLSDRIIVLNQGALIAQGVPAEIAKNELVIEAYLGRGRRNAEH